MTLDMTRRLMLAASMTFGASFAVPRMAFAADTDRRFVFVIQRGAADGLAIVQPHGDPALRRLRAPLVDDDAHDIDGFFALHPAMLQTAQMFAQGQGQAWHAVATGYRERSHFDGQNVLESGASRPYGKDTGWLGRLLPLLPGTSAPLALSASVPLALRGERQVATYSANRVPDPSEDLLARLSTLYEEDDSLAPLWQEALRTRDLAGDIAGGGGRGGQRAGALAAQLLAAQDGPRVLMIETGGWDTHRNQPQRLAGQLEGLDALLGALKEGLGAIWNDTAVLVATEFGRTAAVNGTAGTDHGTASAALLLGGRAGAGGRVIADWPGLGPSQLFESRDLRATSNVLELATGAFADHFELDRDRALAALRS